MRIVLGATNPDSAALRPLLKNTIPVRLVGQVTNAATARAITGMPDSQAEYLMGQGDFVAVSNGMILPFQAAYINDYDLHLILDKLHRQSQPVMLAQPMTIRPTLADTDDEPEQPQSFEFNSHDRRASFNPTENVGSDRADSKLVEPTDWTIVKHWDNPEDGIEAAVLEELEEIEEEDDWFDDDEESEEADVVIDVWADLNKKSNYLAEVDDRDKSEKSKDAPLEVWSRPNNEPRGNSLEKSFNDEIEFEWE
jgi:DNA segregation ATPase FtsK/SpoIIIE-like protein